MWYRSHTEPLFKSNQILKFEDMYTMQISLFVYDLNNDLLPKSFRNLLSQNCLASHGIITRQNNLIPQSRPRTTFSSKLPKHNFTRIWNKTGSTLAHGKSRLTFKRLLKNSYLQCRIYSVADVAYATGPALLGAPRFYLDFFYKNKTNLIIIFYLRMINHVNVINFFTNKVSHVRKITCVLLLL